MKCLSFLQLIRWKNLVILASTLLIIKYGFINIFADNYSLDHFRFIILLTSIVLIAAAGYIINDIQDIETDKINKPNKIFIGTKFSISQAYNWYFIFNISGVLMGFYLANFLQKPIFSSISIIVSFLLYFYSTTLKKTPIIGNILVASLISLSVLILGYLDLILNVKSNDLGLHYLLFELIFEFSIFAFLINFIREIVKDVEDINGDNKLNMNTLPIFIGIKFSKLFIGFLTLLLVIALIYFTINYLPLNTIIFYYFIIAIIFPLIYFAIKLYFSVSKNDFGYLSKILKICMLTGVFSILLITLSIKNVI
ncbi:MAG: geranylgeranylglycerol-phosphate geranylgeranyltransferase [Flavobacteriaceae bacterium]|nr:geranylgeranylglycerol-phosphate geranylgeranyltransferase [Flavobacteriaceae bacterium]